MPGTLAASLISYTGATAESCYMEDGNGAERWRAGYVYAIEKGVMKMSINNSRQHTINSNAASIRDLGFKPLGSGMLEASAVNYSCYLRTDPLSGSTVISYLESFKQNEENRNHLFRCSGLKTCCVYFGPRPSRGPLGGPDLSLDPWDPLGPLDPRTLPCPRLVGTQIHPFKSDYFC